MLFAFKAYDKLHFRSKPTLSVQLALATYG